VTCSLFEANIRDQDESRFSNNMSYSIGPHRMQLNTQYSDQSYPRPIRRDFVDFAEDGAVVRIEEELIDNTQQNWENQSLRFDVGETELGYIAATARSDRYTGVPMTQGSAGHHIHQKKGNAT
jgi:hypothetical protein